MNPKPLFFCCLTGWLAGVSPGASVQPAGHGDNDQRVLNQRADKIVATLDLSDAARAGRVRDLIAGQYRALSAIHDQRDARIKAAKATAGATKETTEAAAEAAREQARRLMALLHQDYLEKLGRELSPAQIDQVKDGMTYGVVPITYRAYLRMLPELTDEQKTFVMSQLVAAREMAMDAGTSDEKHQVFGQFKGRINNHLSAQGYDLKAASKRLQRE